MPSEQPSSTRPFVSDRRAILRTLGAAAVGSGLSAGTAAAGDPVDIEITVGSDRYTVEQGGRTVEVAPLAGDVPVRELYDLRIPAEYEGDNGATDPGESPYFMSAGTRDLQRPSTTITFLYDGPNGLSLVVVHDAEDDDGGSVSWTVSGDLDGLEWLVKDDYYVDPETGEPADTNYDNWRTDGDVHRIDWTWADIRGDGGVLGHFEDGVDLTVEPAYNEAAALFDQHYEGTMDAWEFLSGDRGEPERFPLALDEPVRIHTGDGDDGDEREDEREREREEAEGDDDRGAPPDRPSSGSEEDSPGRGPPAGDPPGRGPPEGEPPGLGLLE